MVKANGGSRETSKGKKGEMMHGSGGGQRGVEANPLIDPRVQREIGKHLRAHYDDLVNEPVPDRFLELLQQLERSVNRKS